MFFSIDLEGEILAEKETKKETFACATQYAGYPVANVKTRTPSGGVVIVVYLKQTCSLRLERHRY